MILGELCNFAGTPGSVSFMTCLKLKPLWRQLMRLWKLLSSYVQLFGSFSNFLIAWIPLDAARRSFRGYLRHSILDFPQ